MTQLSQLFPSILRTFTWPTWSRTTCPPAAADYSPTLHLSHLVHLFNRPCSPYYTLLYMQTISDSMIHWWGNLWADHVLTMHLHVSKVNVCVSVYCDLRQGPRLTSKSKCVGESHSVICPIICSIFSDRASCAPFPGLQCNALGYKLFSLECTAADNLANLLRSLHHHCALSSLSRCSILQLDVRFCTQAEICAINYCSQIQN